MTIPNILTCIRVLLIPVFLVLAYQPSPKCAIWALVVYIVACCTDFVDGYLARKWHQITDFGKFMDPVADKILVLAALIVHLARTDLTASCEYLHGTPQNWRARECESTAAAYDAVARSFGRTYYVGTGDAS